MADGTGQAAVDEETPSVSSPGLTKFKPNAPAKYQGFHFKKLKEQVGRHGHKLFFGLQTLGGIGLLLSGLLTGNPGRATTGLANTFRNAVGVGYEKRLGFLKKIPRNIGRPALMGAAVLSNLPQLIGAATVVGATGAELVAAAAIVTAYSLLVLPGIKRLASFTQHEIKDMVNHNTLFKGRKAKTKMRAVLGLKPPHKSGFSKFMHKVEHGGNTALNKSIYAGAVYVAPALLWLRAAAQLADGVIRSDPSAIMAGLAFLTAPLTLAAGTRYMMKMNDKVRMHHEEKWSTRAVS